MTDRIDKDRRKLLRTAAAALLASKNLIVAVLALSTWSADAAAAPENAEPPARILFVCEHGNVKSLMAVSYFNQIATEKHLPFIAISRGLAPDSATVPPAIAQGLRGQGFDVSSFHPVKLSAQDVTAARRAIAIDVPSLATAENGSAAMESWDDVPPATINFHASSASIKAHVETLIAQLAATQGEEHARHEAGK